MTEPQNALVIDCLDRWGRRVVAYKTRWDDHIRPGHPEMGNHFPRVQAAIEQPDFVMYDKDDAGREVFYRLLTAPDFYPGLYLKVCIAFNSAPRPAVVVTAHLSSRIGTKEAHKWP